MRNSPQGGMNLPEWVQLCQLLGITCPRAWEMAPGHRTLMSRRSGPPLRPWGSEAYQASSLGLDALVYSLHPSKAADNAEVLSLGTQGYLVCPKEKVTY